MAVYTENRYGKITISDNVIAALTAHTALECYGVVDVVSKRLVDAIAAVFGRSRGGRGVKVTTSGNRIYLSIFVILKDGIKVEEVIEQLKNTVKYRVETITGMRVMEVNITVMGVRV